MAASEKHILDTLQHIENEITSTLNELSSIKKEMDAEVSDESNRVLKFIFNLQRSGFSQQFNAGECIEKHFGFSKDKAEGFLFNYIENLSELTEKFSLTSELSESSSQGSDSQSQQKKRKGPKPYSEMTSEELAAAKEKKLAKALEAEKKEPVAEVLTPQLIASVPLHEQAAQPLHEQAAQPKIKAARRILKKEKNPDAIKKTSDAIKIWNSFLKIVKTEMEATGTPCSYDEVVKRAKEMKEGDKSAYELFSATWTPDDESLASNS